MWNQLFQEYSQILKYVGTLACVMNELVKEFFVRNVSNN